MRSYWIGSNCCLCLTQGPVGEMGLQGPRGLKGAQVWNKMILSIFMNILRKMIAAYGFNCTNDKKTRWVKRDRTRSSFWFKYIEIKGRFPISRWEALPTQLRWTSRWVCLRCSVRGYRRKKIVEGIKRALDPWLVFCRPPFSSFPLT